MSAPLILHLMRHGAPEERGLMIGHHDAPASAAGIAACVAKARDLTVASIVTSDLARAAACAAAVSRITGIGVARDARWREIDFGAWDGQAAGAIDAAALAAFWDDPDANPPPGGESWSALRARVGAALATIAAPSLVIAHAGSIRAALSVLCGFDYRQCWAIDVPCAAVISLRIWREPTPVAQIIALRP